MTDTNRNAEILEEELAWFRSVLEERIRNYFNPECNEKLLELPAPSLEGSDAWYPRFIR